jgi:hypothetical protein
MVYRHVAFALRGCVQPFDVSGVPDGVAELTQADIRTFQGVEEYLLLCRQALLARFLAGEAAGFDPVATNPVPIANDMLNSRPL